MTGLRPTKTNSVTIPPTQPALHRSVCTSAAVRILLNSRLMYLSKVHCTAAIAAIALVAFSQSLPASSSLKIYNDYLSCVKTENGLNEKQCFDRHLGEFDPEHPVAKAVIELLNTSYFNVSSSGDLISQEPKPFTRLDWLTICMASSKSEGEDFADSLENCIWTHLDVDLSRSQVIERFPGGWDSYPETFEAQISYLKVGLTVRCADLISPSALEQAPSSDE